MQYRGNSPIVLSKLVFIYFAEWLPTRISNEEMKCFIFTSRLNIKSQKSKLIVVGVNFDRVEDLADIIGWAVISIPFVCLGLPIWESMSQVGNYKDLISKFMTKLSNCKANMLSIGVKFTLWKFVFGSLGIDYISLFKVQNEVIKFLELLHDHLFWLPCEKERFNQLVGRKLCRVKF